MGRCPEDGQTVFFETIHDEAVDFFGTSKVIPGWESWLSVVSPNLYAIYTCSLEREFHTNVVEASRRFGEAYWTLICDESESEIWIDGSKWTAGLAGQLHRQERRKMNREMQNSIFPRAQAAYDGKLWERIHDYSWEDKMHRDFILEKDD